MSTPHNNTSQATNPAPSPQETEEFKAWKAQCATHRMEMQKTENAMIDEFAKALMTLSAGAIDVSLTMLKDVIKLENLVTPHFISWAWACWTAALACTVAGYYTPPEKLTSLNSEPLLGNRSAFGNEAPVPTETNRLVQSPPPPPEKKD